jgi:hypothetical protein
METISGIVFSTVSTKVLDSSSCRWTALSSETSVTVANDPTFSPSCIRGRGEMMVCTGVPSACSHSSSYGEMPPIRRCSS